MGQQILRQRWHTTIIVVHGEVVDAAALPALIAQNRQGLATYRLRGRDAELITLDAISACAGIGTALIEALSTKLHAEGCERLWVTTTNDKLSALRFYLRRGFSHHGAGRQLQPRRSRNEQASLVITSPVPSDGTGLSKQCAFYDKCARPDRGYIGENRGGRGRRQPL